MNKAQIYFTKVWKLLAIAIVVLPILFVFVQTSSAAAGINKTINFQGKVINKTTGVNVTDGTYAMVFKIYDKASGGTALWTENDASVQVTDGIFRVQLGAGTAFPAGMNWNQDGLFLDITFNSEAMGSRIQLTAVPYAMNAGQVAGLTVQDSTSGAASTSATLKLGDATTPKTFDLGTNNLTFTTSGTTTLTLPTSGTVTALGNTTTGSGTTLVLASNPSLTGLTLSSGAITLGGVTGSGLCITGGATAAWGSCGSGGGTNYWNLGAGFITPINSTADLLIGSQATTSAKFSVTNLAGNGLIPIASISGNLIVYPDAGNKGGNLGVGVVNPATRLDVGINDLQNETIQVKSKLTSGLEIVGDSDNGVASGGEIGNSYVNFSIDGGTNTGVIGLANLNGIDPKGNTVQGGNGNAFMISTTGTNVSFEIATNGRSRLSMVADGTTVFGNANTTPRANFDIRPQIGTLAVASVSGSQPYASLVVDNGGTNDIFTASNAGVPKFTIASSGNITWNATTLTAPNFSTLSSAPSLGVSATTLTLGNGSAATITTTTNGLTLDSGSNTLTIASSDTILSATGIATFNTASTLAISATTTKFGTNPGTTGAIGIPNNTYITARNAANNADINLIKVDGSNLVAFGANTAAFTLGGSITGNSQTITGLGGITINGGSTIDSATSGTLALASTTNTTALTIGNSGMTSGLTFNIDTAANYTFQKEGSAYSCSGTDKLTLNGSGALTCATDQTGAGGGGGSNWTLSTANGTLSPNNNTLDLFVGGTATTSAKFAVLGVNNARGTQTASVSGSLSLDSSTASVQSTLFQTLTLGGLSTGNIVIAPWNGAANSSLQIKAANTYLGINGSLNGSISFYSSGASITPPTISTDSSGNLNLAATQAGASVVVGSGVGDIVIDPSAYKVGVGISSSIISQLHVTRALSNGATGKALAIFDQIENQDILTASKGGVTKFTVDQNGIGTFAGGLTLTSGPITLGGVTGSGLCLNGGATASWASCGAGGGGTNYLGQTNGLTWVGNSTTDFAIGGNSTGSAKFVFGGVNAGTPTATFSGDLIINNKPSTASTDMQRWTKITGTAGTIGGNNSSIASISAAVVYNGSLYVGTNKANAAEIYRYNGDPSNTWTSVSGTAGTVGGGATTAIDMISSLTVYNGYLYAGTTEADKAEVYRYDGVSAWTKVSGTAGTFSATTLIDGVSSMAVFGGRLFIGTKESLKAEIYMYNGGTTWAAVNGTAGTFVATNTIAQDAVTQMVVWNNTLIAGTMKNGVADADVIRWNGIVGGSNFFALNLASTTGSYLIDNAAQTGYFEVTSMTIWAGKLIVGLRRGAGQADILMYQEPPSGAAPINSWTRLNSAAGTIVASGTSSIDTVTSMNVYDGRLYIGTNKANSGEIYRYDQDKNWIKVSQNTAGTIAGGGTASIDQVAVLLPYNHNSLFAGTSEGTSAEGYTYNTSIDQSYALKFNSGASAAGGVQNNNQNYGSIIFVASLSANLNNKQGNTGTFVFDHSIMSTNGSYDVAEDYPTRDDTIEPGDVVSLDTNERGFVVKSNGAYDYTAVGVYSEKPGLRLSQDDSNLNGGKAIPIALVGRVPVKVSTENGEIKQGDPLTPSSKPGVAMKAKKSGLIIAQAMEPYSGEGVGKITAYVKSTSYDGSIAESFENIDVNSSAFGQNVLDQLAQQPSTGTSDIVTDRMVANIEIVSPKITVDELFAKRIVAGQIDGLDVITNRLAILETKVASLSGTLKSAPESSESALLAKQNDLIDKISKDLSQRSSGPTASQGGISSGILDSSGLTILPGGIRVKGNGLFEGIVTVLDTLTTNNFIVNGVSTFFQDAVFKAKIAFEGPVTFSSDTGGFAKITKGMDRVNISFDNEFENDPVVNTSISFDERKDDQGNIISTTDLEQSYFKQGYKYIIVNRSKKGFTIVLNKKAADDLNFTWTAIQVKDAKTIQSRLPD